jgi:MT0933-like antitoxin protein
MGADGLGSLEEDTVGLLDKARALLGKHDDKVDQAIDKAGDAAKHRFQGHDEQIDKLTQMGKDYDFSGGQGGATEGQPPAEGKPAAEGQPPAGGPPPAGSPPPA